MAEASKYFVRTKNGQKGPYTLEQMRASLVARVLSAGAEYREGDDGEWRPIEHLKKELAREDAGELAERIERAPEIVVGDDGNPRGGRPARTGKDYLALALIAVVIAGGLIWMRSRRLDALGEPCRVTQDCPSGMSCLLEVAEDRRIRPEGYCTMPCTGSSDCAGKMSCGDAVTVRPQGATWDGMFDKNARVCLKR